MAGTYWREPAGSTHRQQGMTSCQRSWLLSTRAGGAAGAPTFNHVDQVINVVVVMQMHICVVDPARHDAQPSAGFHVQRTDTLLQPEGQATDCCSLTAGPPPEHHAPAHLYSDSTAFTASRSSLPSLTADVKLMPPCQQVARAHSGCWLQAGGRSRRPAGLHAAHAPWLAMPAAWLPYRPCPSS